MADVRLGWADNLVRKVGKETIMETMEKESAVVEQGGHQGAAAFFDLDGTLIRGSANIPLAVAAFRHGFMSKRELLNDLKNGLSFVLKGATDERSAEVRDRILKAVKGHRAAEVITLGDDFLDKLVADVQPESHELLSMHRSKGDARVILSASPTEIVGPLADRLGLEYGIGTTASRVNGVYSGTLDGPFCYREGKAEIMRAMAAEHGWNLADCTAYSDSASDLPMLEAVGHAVVMGPDKELRQIAAQRGWPIVETDTWRSLSKRELPGAAWKSVQDSIRDRVNA